jgi:Calcineurin-like phosphoesterase
MQILLIHLSDIHVKTGREGVLSRAAKIKDACHAVAPNASACVIVVSGDIAHSGLQEQYDAAYSFLTQLRDDLLALPSVESVEFVAVPGNHDCDFNNESDIRQYLLKDVEGLYESNVQPGSDRTKAILEVQQNFFAFEARLTNGKEVSLDQRLSYGRLVRFGNYSIKFQCYNTAWLSRKHELQSKLFLPPDAMEPVAAEANICAAIFHHPYNWLDANNYRILKDTVEQTVDLVFTGHEHQAGGGAVERFSGEHLHYLEAAALQGESGELDSGFATLTLDIESGGQRLDHFRWNHEFYESSLQRAWTSIIINPARERHLFKLNPTAVESLLSPGAPFTHKHKRGLKLDDIYIYPDITQWSAERLTKGGEKNRTINSKGVLEYFRTTPHVLITGPDDSGKSALLKKLFVDMSSEFVPIRISGTDFSGKISETKFRRVIESAVEYYYDSHSIERFLRLDPSRRVLLFDDFQLARITEGGALGVVEFARNMFSHVFIAAQDIYRVRALTGKGSADDLFRGFDSCHIKEFGHRLRAQLINKWLSLGRDAASELQAIEYESSATQKVITTMLGKNVIPSSPFNILTLLHTMESAQPHSTSDGSFGALYELLIKTSLKLASGSGPDDTELKFTYISVIAFVMFERDQQFLSESDLRKVHEDYGKQFGYSPPFEQLIEQLVSAKVLERVDGNYYFKYKHFYFYFVAKYFERALKRKDARAESLRRKMEYMADRLHSEELANIVLVYLYLTQDWELSQYILRNARLIFAGREICNLGADVEFINKIYKEPPKMLIPDSDVEGHRDKYNEQLDKSEEDSGPLLTLDRDATYNDSLSDMHKINIAFKTLQVLGQILRSSAHSLEADVKQEIVNTSYMLGLRTMKTLLGIAETNTEELRRYLSILIRERAALANSNVSENELLRLADEGLIWLTFACAYGTIKKISYAIGHVHLEEIYNSILSEHSKVTSVRLIDLAIKLEHFPTVPLGDITQVRDKVVGNLFGYSLLRQMVADFLYLHRTEFRTGQKLGSLFKIDGVTSPKFLLPDKKIN